MEEHDLYLKYLTQIGLEDRVLAPEFSMEHYNERVEHELYIIREAGFSTYFLIVQDLLRFCRERRIPVGPGRGSVCGSLVCYLLRITDVDPIKWDIPFERFLHLERISQPDIDLDICKRRRGEVINYIKDKYGEESVAQIVTYGTIQARGAVKRAFKDLEVETTITGRFSMDRVNKITSLIPEGSGADQVILSEWLGRDEPEVIEFKDQIAKVGQLYASALNRKGITSDFLLDTILYLEGRRAHGSVHSAGVVIGSGPLVDLGIPLGKRNKDAEVHCEHDMIGAEKVGLLKLDLLGLRTVTLIGDVEDLIKSRHDSTFDIKSVPIDDDETYVLLGGGPARLNGVFQLSKDSIGNAMKGINPTEFEDIIALLALYRPGPMKQLETYGKLKKNVADVTFPHRDLKQSLGKTYGLIVYQEQVMSIVQILGGYTPGEADVFRKAIGKKIPELIIAEISKFKDRAIALGHDEEMLNDLGEQIADFGRYGFNRGHATGYGFLTYWTAYLKCHYKVEFYTALLNSYVGDTEKIAQYTADAINHDIQFLPPDVNESGLLFTVVDDNTIRFGLEGIKGLGNSAAVDVVEYRESDEINIYRRQTVEREKIVDDKIKKYKASIKITERGLNPNKTNYQDFVDFCQRHPGIPITSKRSMIAAGCFDFGDSDLVARGRLYEIADLLNKESKKKRPSPVEEPEHHPTFGEMLSLEKEVLGTYVSHHPLSPHRDILRYFELTKPSTFDSLRTGRHIAFAGIVSKIRLHRDKNGKEMAWLTFESDWHGLPEMTVFSSLWKSITVKEGDLVISKASKSKHDKFGEGLQAESASVVDKTRLKVKNILFKIPSIDLDDVLLIESSLSDTGVQLSIMTEVGDKRLALIKTKSFIPKNISRLAQFVDEGWEVVIDPDKILTFDHARCERSDQTIQGRGDLQRGVWELPGSKLVTKRLGGTVVAEYNFA